MLHSNKAILDEAARSVRRTFIGSVAGSLGMLIVVGAAGAYGMPEHLTAQALTAAMAKLNMSFPHAAALVTQPAERAMQLVPNETAHEPKTVPATNLTRRPVVMPVANDPVVRTMPTVAPVATVAAVPVAAPVVPPAPAPREDTVAPAAPMTPPAPPIAEASVPAPAPAAASSVPPRAWVDGGDAPRVIPAPMVFEAPNLSDIKPLEAMPKTEPVAAATEQPKADERPVLMQIAKEIAKEPATESAKPIETPAAAAKPMQLASLASPAPFEFPQTALLPMPLAKPPLTPAQRLDLSGKEYDKAEKCLAQAIYFEARNEPARGQMAVAQVVLNRVFSPYYPKDVCSVVYQNAHHFLGCQFTFACDGKPEAIREYGAWARANRIAKEALAAKIWLPDVAKATHYHAAYVRPSWIRDMRVMVRYGLHTFYRPRNWGDGSNEPAWGAGAKKSAKS